MLEKKNKIFVYIILTISFLFLCMIVFSKSNTSITILNNSKRELHASTESTYNIVFYKNNPNATGSMAKTNNISYSETFKLPENKFAVKKLGVKSKQIFVGWNTKADGTGKSYNDKAKVSKLTQKNNATISLYAQWEDAYYQVSNPVTYTETLGDAVNISKADSKITYIGNDIYDFSTVNISKNLTIDIQDRYLNINETILINNGATVTFEGTGFMINDGDNNLFTLTDRSKLIKKGTAIWTSWMRNVIHITNSSFELYGGYLLSYHKRPIYGCITGDSVINNTTVYLNTYTDNVMRLTGPGNLTINGNSKIGNGNAYEYSYGDEPASVIGWASTGVLTLDDNATIYENGMGSCGIVAGANSEVRCLGNSSIYVNLNLERLKSIGAKEYGYQIDRVDPKGYCISLDSSSKLTLNSTGDFFTLGDIAIAFKTDNNGKSGTFTYTKGKLATRNTKNTVRRYDKYTKHNHPDTLNNGERVQERFFMMTYPDGCNYDDYDAYKNIKSHVWNVYEYSK